MRSSSTITKLKKGLEMQDSAFLKMFQALGDPVRLGIVKLLNEEKTLCVTEIARVFNISVPAASYQLKLLESSGILKLERMGQMKCYVVATEKKEVKSIVQLLVKGRTARKKNKR